MTCLKRVSIKEEEEEDGLLQTVDGGTHHGLLVDGVDAEHVDLHRHCRGMVCNSHSIVIVNVSIVFMVRSQRVCVYVRACACVRACARVCVCVCVCVCADYTVK